MEIGTSTAGKNVDVEGEGQVKITHLTTFLID